MQQLAIASNNVAYEEDDMENIINTVTNKSIEDQDDFLDCIYEKAKKANETKNKGKKGKFAEKLSSEDMGLLLNKISTARDTLKLIKAEKNKGDEKNIKKFVDEFNGQIAEITNSSQFHFLNGVRFSNDREIKLDMPSQGDNSKVGQLNNNRLDCKKRASSREYYKRQCKADKEICCPNNLEITEIATTGNVKAKKVIHNPTDISSSSKFSKSDNSLLAREPIPEGQ